MQWLIDLILESLTGIIVAWSGAIADIPAGWALCDGTNGTPDLSGKFIYGTKFEVEIGDTGGHPTHIHDVVGDGHRHEFEPGPGGYDAGTKDRDDVTGPKIITGTTLLGTFLPPYYRLAYIMKL